jgi:hypothetical protein
MTTIQETSPWTTITSLRMSMEDRIEMKEAEDNNNNHYNPTTNLFNHSNKETERMQVKDNTINLK